MKSVLLLFSLLMSLLVSGCSVRTSLQKNFSLPTDLEETAQREIAAAVFRTMQSQSFADDVKQKFPTVTREQLLRTNLGWKVFVTDRTRGSYIIVSVNDTSNFPEAEAVLDFSLAFAKQQADQLVAQAYAQGKRKMP